MGSTDRLAARRSVADRKPRANCLHVFRCIVVHAPLIMFASRRRQRYRKAARK
jgi:hypothetical protein